MINISFPMNSRASRKSWACKILPLNVSKPGNSGTLGVEKCPEATTT